MKKQGSKFCNCETIISCDVGIYRLWPREDHPLYEAHMWKRFHPTRRSKQNWLPIFMQFTGHEKLLSSADPPIPLLILNFYFLFLFLFYRYIFFVCVWKPQSWVRCTASIFEKFVSINFMCVHVNSLYDFGYMYC